MLSRTYSIFEKLRAQMLVKHVWQHQRKPIINQPWIGSVKLLINNEINTESYD